jgi:glycosyltransferase involved in cell wall biosynthesis
MKVWIFQSGEPLHTDSDQYRPMRAMNISDFLVKNGHDVILWSSSFFHTTKQHRSKDFKKIKVNQNLEIRLLPSCGYKKNIGFMRILDHIQLAFNLKNKIKKETNLPDVLFIGYPPIETSLVLIRWAKKNRIKTLLDVKDLWPSVFIDYLPIWIKPLLKICLFPYFLLAKYSIKNASCVTSMSKGHLEMTKNLIGEEVSTHDGVFPLTTEEIDINSDQIESARLWWTKLGVKKDDGKKRVTFIGSLNKSYDFNPIINSIKSATRDKLKLEFIICGDGESFEFIKSKIGQYDNVVIPGWITRPQIKFLAELSSASLVPFRNIKNFQNNTPNKIVDSLMLGLPILCELDGEVSKLISENYIGIKYNRSSNKNLYSCIKKITSDSELQREMAYNSRNLYKEKFSYEKVYNNFVSHIESLK